MSCDTYARPDPVNAPCAVLRKLRKDANTVIDKAPEASILERQVWNSSDLCCSAFCKEPTVCIQCNVPLDALVSLVHTNMWEKENKIWCDGLFGSKGLHCDGWPEDFGDYFLSPIKSKWFPAQGSSEILNVYAYGGAAHCANGVHRLLGGMVVLLKEFGDKAFLNQVNVTYHPLKVGAAEILDLALKENLKVESNGDFIRLRRLIGPFATYDARNKDALVECSPRDVKLAEKVEEKWKRMPREVIEKLLKNDWLHSQLLPAGGLTLEPVLETS